ncbi:uncharacterized protein LOC131152407 isoform X2 [Malania oleifera]|uniref:uncharacterized protein LOC131152407 isoform X2 n=1 Tax=Malania oleifera TaxID=397392 RepID=UPI0025AEC48D|nr:uncharacterized protein LOC131152407 isoform X2 [Malania oleifera]
MADDSILERERHQIQQIRELEFEELQIEEVESLRDSDDDDRGGAGTSGEITFNTCLASMHTYLGEVEDTHHRLACFESGAILNLPLFYLEGVVLFPEATLPLRVIQPNFIAVVNRALSQVDAPYIIGVIHVYRDSDDRAVRFATIGTTAEIRQYRQLEDGSVNVVTRGQQRFHLKRRWIDVEGMPLGEVQIIQEDLPLRTPRDAFGKLPPLVNTQNCSPSSARRPTSHSKGHGYGNEDSDSEGISDESFESELSPSELRMHRSAIDSCSGYDIRDESTSSDEEKFVCESEFQLGKSNLDSSIGLSHSDNEKWDKKANLKIRERFILKRQLSRQEMWKKGWMTAKLNQSHQVPRAFWPYWVYRMYDSYYLAQRAADMWKRIVAVPGMDALVKKPGLLSFYIASKIPVSESTRQELLDIDGISHRLRREIELLESFDRIRCKNCQTVIARRSDMLVMSSEGPLGAYVNPNGFVHEIMTFYKANGLALYGRSTEEYSWFPGYAWTITQCATCESQMGWLFTAVNRKLKPISFWGIRSSQVADDMR